MNEKIICEKCGHEMNNISSKRPVGMTCPNCGWGWATTYNKPIYDDATIYTIILSSNNIANKNNLKTIAKLLNCNFIEAKKAIENAPTIIASNVAYKIKDIVDTLSNTQLMYTISPDFPYVDDVDEL